MAKPDLRRVLAVLSKSSASFGYEVALDSLEEALKRGAIDSYSVQAIAARLAFDGLQGKPLSGPDLEAYDRAFIGGTGGRQ
jgi:hypothetical protein